jgi:hypothetical protein
VKSFAATIDIHATPERIWALLTDAAAYPSWNSTVAKVVGRIAGGEKIVVHATGAGGRAFPLRVGPFEPCTRMVWSGGMPFGLFTGQRTFRLDPKAGGVVTVSMREEFAGLLAPLITRSIPDLQPAFDRFVADLKVRAERVA